MNNICKLSNHIENKNEFYEYIHTLEITLRKIKVIKLDSNLLSNLRDLKHILFLMKDISYPIKLNDLKNKIINYLNIFENVCFELEENIMREDKLSNRQLILLDDLYFEINKLLIEIKEKL